MKPDYAQLDQLIKRLRQIGRRFRGDDPPPVDGLDDELLDLADRFDMALRPIVVKR